MHLILYKINKNDSELYDIIKYNIEKFGNTFFYKMDSDEGFEFNVFEGNIANEEITIYFEGKVNFIWLSIKYSQFLNHKLYYERVLNFERSMLELISSDADIYRIDEILLEDLILNKGVYWYKDNNANTIFNEWIKNEEKLHWLKIEIPYKELNFESFLKERG
ncbi:hypothetical protein [Flavobacterium sp. UBA7680]|uniref:hypothetical protein n=1 Tax=Flavobacterium sp. UBA7680 TaxID=1946559 RepID=UPI0025B905C8|nr:hypothetical protein [Flavobacterium sp. UBA7680]